jgi:hypothetical protein
MPLIEVQQDPNGALVHGRRGYRYGVRAMPADRRGREP